MEQVTVLESTPERIVALIRQGDPTGEELLYSVLSKGMRYLAVRQLGPDDGLECFHDTFIKLVAKIKEGALNSPDALFGYARTILKREIADRFEERRRFGDSADFEAVALTRPDPSLTPDQVYEAAGRIKTMKQAMLSLRPKEREVLVRFYLNEQDGDTIQREMRLSATQYRLLKSRSKHKLQTITSKALTASTDKAPTPEMWACAG
jgi:RNA polymerase sigma-70 factor, ECF subfamily